MASNNPQPKRPPTYFFPATPKWAAIVEAGASRSHPHQQVQERNNSTAILGTHRSHGADSGNKGARSSKVPILNEDPWADYEKGIEIFPKRHIFLARHREKKGELVHVQQLEEGVETRPLLNTITCLSHRSFLRLLRCYQYEGLAFLVWEPVELSLSQIIGSKYSIREAELVSIVWPVSTDLRVMRLAPQLTTLQIQKGTRHLRDSNRALASLTNETILLTDSGSVKIAEIERSCEIHAADMNAVTPKLFALSEIIEGLWKQMNPLDPWSPEAQNLSAKLMEVPLDDVLRDDLFAQMQGGELKMMVNIVSKSSHYDTKFS
ncbi:hypothetical protein N7449_007617 [Penicillium cf. viridicatum]|uniref:Uncharacterized protein n=1 Tax=Penicillium cf. viridicatum TaxID=2972119 RepID=A0A9W9MCR2_9EURO|nr:hypothetical protein N7449_007617 [Penicillium cf. viridicatum]